MLLHYLIDKPYTQGDSFSELNQFMLVFLEIEFYYKLREKCFSGTVFQKSFTLEVSVETN